MASKKDPNKTENPDAKIELDEADVKEETEPQQEDPCAALEKELAAAKEAHIRTLAEYDNYRKRTTREKEALYGDAKAAALGELLPVLDNFERALGTQDADAEE